MRGCRHAGMASKTWWNTDEFILGIAMHESAYGNSKVCRLLNNHHGIAGRNNLRQTHGIKSRYRYFETDTASFVAFCELVKKRKYYPGMIAEKKTTTQWLLTIGRAGYCSNPTAWTKAIKTILRRNNLI
jgi:flagellum-specific peptidoglycan hydrolase FlgJ